jgi:cell division transport system permease protein
MTQSAPARSMSRQRGAGLRAWLRAHGNAITNVLQQLARTPLAHALTVAVLGIALALPLGLYVILHNVERLGEGWDMHTARMSLYLKTTVDDAGAARLANTIAATPGVANVQLISREEALDEYRAYSGFADALAALGGNPLPAVLLVDPAAGANLQGLVAQLRALPELDTLKFDMEWVQRLRAITALAERAVQVIAAVLAVAVLLVAGNAIRVAVAQRREEIEICKLCGATDAYIRRPFLYTGFLYGAVGGLLACAVVLAALAALVAPVARLAELYQSTFAPTGLSWRATVAVALAGGVLGLVGAWWTAAHHIRSIEVK